MPICIAGVPFSGVSMVARILDGLGVDVGPQENLLGENGSSGDFWGDRRFARLNEAILDAVGAAWDVPPTGVGRWAEHPQLEPLRKQAKDVADSLALTEPWAWADPRNALTLPFWRSLYPDLQVVVCIRHPHEVAKSLEAHGSTPFSEGLALWGSYYSAVAAAAVGDLVTNSDRLLEEPTAEVERLVNAVGLSPSRAEIKRAVGALAARDGGEMPSDSLELPPDIDELYRTLLEAASSSRGDSKPAATRSTTTARRGPAASDLRDVVAAQRVELENLRLELIRKRGYLEALQAQLDVRTSSDLDLGQVIYSLEKQLLERDEEIAALREQRIDAETHLRAAIDGLEEKLARLAGVQSTRLWRLGQQYWALKRSVRRALKRETP
jgi:hypothetical protein